MVYLDYSATTPVSKHVLDKSYDFSKKYYANPNSIHKLGKESHQVLEDISKQIQGDLNLLDHQIVYTSGATESNNLAIKGYCLPLLKTKNHLITTAFEHGSIVSILNDLSKQGLEVDIVELDAYGRVNLDHLESLITEKTALVSIGLVNSEIGVVQDLKAIRKVIMKFPGLVLHSDMTQAIGKVKLDYQAADLISLSGHKIYGFKGIGALLVKDSLKLKPVIHGGKSLSPLRGGTPPLTLIYSLGLAIHDSYQNFNQHLSKIQGLHEDLIEQLKKIDSVFINSNQYSIPQILNISFLKGLALDVQTYLSDHDIFVSTTSACSSGTPMSRVVMTLTGDEKRAQSSIRVSLSHLTTTKEIETFVRALEAYHEGC